MSTTRVLRYLFLLLLLPTGWLCLPSTAHADVFCQANVAPVSFGTVDPQTGASTQVAITAQCTNYDRQNYDITLCYNIGNGPAGLNGSNRQMPGSNGGNLHFQLWRDAAHSQIAGSINSSTNSTPISVQFRVDKAGGSRWNPTPTNTNAPLATLYASIPAPQPGVAGGSYASTFAGVANVELTGNLAYTSCGNTMDDGQSTLSSFIVSAAVPPTCTIVAGPTLNLGTVSSSATNMAGNNAITVTCTNGTPYYVGLAPSNGNSAGAGLMSGTGGNLDQVPYQLRSTAGLAGAIWGNTATATSVGNGVAGSGTGSGQSMTVYATAPSANYTPDTYTDIVTIHVNY